MCADGAGVHIGIRPATRSLAVGDSGAKGGRAAPGEDKALELLELRHSDLQTRETPTPSRSFQAVNDSEDGVGEQRIEVLAHSGDKALGECREEPLLRPCDSMEPGAQDAGWSGLRS